MSKFLSFKSFKVITIFYIQDFSGSEIYKTFDKKEIVEYDQSEPKKTRNLNILHEEEDCEVPRAIGAVSKENARFFTLKEAYRCISERKYPVLDKIPCGDKSNSFLLLSVDQLVKDSIGRIKYFDDCGVYGSSASHKYLLAQPFLNVVHLKNGQYYQDLRKTKLIQSVKEADIVKVNVLSKTLKSNDNFKCQITRVEGTNIALVEYIGNNFILNYF